MNLKRTSLFALALTALALPAVAGVHKFASGTSHQLDLASVALHDYAHEAFGTSYGSHGMDLAADAAHDTLHDYGNGNATEADVEAAVDAVNAAFDIMRDQFIANNVWADKTAKKMYDDVHKYKVLLNAYTN